jgi:YVTN family beta-propeller protein
VSRLHRMVLVVPLVAGLLACSLQGQMRSADQPPDAPSPTIDSAAATPVDFDLCTLFSASEISDALGEAVEAQPGTQSGACTYATTTASQPKSLAVSAAQGAQARDLVQMSASLGLMFGGDAVALQTAEDLKANAASMSLQEVVDKGNTLLAPLGYVFTPAGNPDSPATWGWNPMGSGTLQQVTGETYLAVSVIGLDEPGAKALTAGLLPLAESRLPSAFSIELGEGLQVQFTAEIPEATAEPTPTLVPAVDSTIWVADHLADRVARIDASTGTILADIAVGDKPVSIAVGEGAVWVGNQSDGTVSRIDPETNQVVATIDVAEELHLRLAAGEGRVWVAACLDKAVKVIDPATNQVTASVPIEGCWNVALGGGQVWVPTGERTVTRIDPTTLTAMPTVFVQSGPAMIVEGFGSMWVANVNAMTVSRFDPLTREVTATLLTGLDHVKNNLRGLAAGEGRVWVSSSSGIQAFDPATNMLTLATSTIADPTYLAVAGGSLWVTTGAPGGIFALDPVSGDLIHQVRWGTAPYAIAAGP